MKFRKHSFTLVELIVSMAVFALLSMMVVQLFSATQKLWVANNQKSEISAEGRLALDFISTLLMSATVNPQLDSTRVGSDYFELTNDGEKPDPDNERQSSRLYFVTKSASPSLVGNSPDVPACFVGIQLVHLSGNSYSDDPDKDHYVLVVGAKTSGVDDFAHRFPNNTKNTLSDLSNFFDNEKGTAFNDIISNSSHKVSRIATNVVDFQIHAYVPDTSAITVSEKIKAGTENTSDTVSCPEAVEIELTLMDRNHYEDFINNDDDESRAKLRNQFSRTFRRIIWLDGTHRTYDMTGDFE